MSGTPHLARSLTLSAPSLRACALGFGLALAAAGSASAEGAVVDCVSGSKAAPERLIAVARGLANGRRDGGLDGARLDEKLASARKQLRAARTES